APWVGLILPMRAIATVPDVNHNDGLPVQLEHMILPLPPRSLSRFLAQIQRKTAFLQGQMMEARVGIEPTHKGFADLSLSHLGTAPIATLLCVTIVPFTQ